MPSRSRETSSQNPPHGRDRQPQLTPADPKRVALLAVVALLVVVAAAWGIAQLVRGGGVGDPAAIAAADSVAADSVVNDSARLVAAYGDTALDSRDTADLATAPPIHPPEFFGTWYHGDARSQYGDSLTLVLWDDGRATAHERRYTLDRTGWHVERVEREGTWLVRHRSNRRPLLCTNWRTPTELSACATVLLTGSAPDQAGDGPMLDFAGRHWRQDRSGQNGRTTSGATRGTAATAAGARGSR